MIVELGKPVHSLPYRVLYGDTDKAGVVYYGAYMRLFEAGRTEYLRNICGTSYSELEKQGIILPVTETYCRYKSSALYDELLEIQTAVTKITRVSIRFDYRIVHSDTGKLAVQGFTVHAAVDRSGKLMKLPESLKKLLAHS